MELTIPLSAYYFKTLLLIKNNEINIAISASRLTGHSLISVRKDVGKTRARKAALHACGSMWEEPRGGSKGCLENQ